MTERSVCVAISLTVGTTMDDEALTKHILDVLLIPDAIEAPEILYVQTVEVDSIKAVPEFFKTIDPPLVELTEEGKKLFNEPLTIPIEDEKGNVHIFEGCYVKSVERNYPADGPLVVEGATTTQFTRFEPGSEVLGQEEADRRRHDMVLETVKAISSERLRWCLTDLRRDELALDPGVKCWMDFATAVLKDRGEL